MWISSILDSILSQEAGVIATIIGTALIVIIFLSDSRQWIQSIRAPQIEASFIFKPIYSGQKTKELSIPKNTHQILYFIFSPTDNRFSVFLRLQRKYLSPLIFVVFPDNFIIDYQFDYNNVPFGKKLEKQGKNVTMIRLENYVQKGAGIDNIVFPIVFTSPSSEGKNKVNIEFASESTRKSYKQELNLIVVENEKDYSYDSALFKPSTHKI